MELKDTVSLMTSDNYKDRFKAEYYQLLIRFVKLRKMVDNWENLEFTPTCHKETYIDQLEHMRQYMYVLERRAQVENIFTTKELTTIISEYSKG